LAKEETGPLAEYLQEDASREKVSEIPSWVYHRNGETAERAQWVINEKAVTLYLNGREMVTLLCAGHYLDELAAGFLHAEGFLNTLDDLVKIEVDEASGKIEVTTRTDPVLANRLWSKRTITSGCGKGSVFYYALDALLSKPVDASLSLTSGQVFERVEDLNRMSETYRRTHGVHNTALASPEKIVLFRDDIGRHNAVDMIVGHVFLRGIPLEDKLLITTGRLTSEIIIKAAKVRIPVIVSRNTATTLAVELARSLNITLIGYARGGKFIVYSGRERIRAGESVNR
jgi:FdhD protein